MRSAQVIDDPASPGWPSRLASGTTAPSAKISVVPVARRYREQAADVQPACR